MGHSHLTAPRLAYAQAQAAGQNLPVMMFYPLGSPECQPETSGGTLHPAIREKLAAARADLHVSVLGGNDHALIGLVNDRQPYDFVLPEAPQLFTDPQAHIIPAALLRAELKRRMAPALETLTALRAAVPGRFLHIESPPPVASTAFILEKDDGFGSLFAERGVAPALLRYKMWRLHSGIVREACAALGIEFCPTPLALLDAQGMFIEAAARDATHGNTLYGRHILAQMLS